MEMWQFFALIAVISFYSIIAINHLRDLVAEARAVTRVLSKPDEK